MKDKELIKNIIQIVGDNPKIKSSDIYKSIECEDLRIYTKLNELVENKSLSSEVQGIENSYEINYKISDHSFRRYFERFRSTEYKRIQNNFQSQIKTAKRVFPKRDFLKRSKYDNKVKFMRNGKIVFIMKGNNIASVVKYNSNFFVTQKPDN